MLRSAARLWITLLALCVQAGPVWSNAPLSYWDLGDEQGPGQVTLYNPDDGDAANGVPIYTLDWNGDGRHEIVMSAFNGDGPRGGPERLGAGEIHVTFWEGTFGGNLHTGVPNSMVVEILGAESGDFFGIELTSGDLDDDGWQDLVVGAFGAGIPGRYHAGKVYVFYGGPEREGGYTLDLAQGLPADATCIVGSDEDDRLGVWSEVADVDGDGVDDLVMGSDRADAPGANREEAGKIVVLPGPLPRGVMLDLAELGQFLKIVYGVDGTDQFGASIAADDLDGDGYAEIIGAAASSGLSRNTYDGGGSGDGPPGQFRLDSGEVWIVWGAPDLPDTIDLKTPPPGVVLSTIYGREWEGRCGEELFTADVNGDHLPELLVGALTTNGPPDDYRRNAGEGYVFYGGTGLRGQTIDLAATNYPHVRIYGTEESIACDSFIAGDINGDGYQDLFVGLPHDFGPTHRHGGTAMVVYGGPSLPWVIDLAAPNVPVTVLDGADPYDDSAYFLASGDVDGDGYDEAIVNAMSGQGWRNRGFLVGDARAVSGAWLTRHPETPTGFIAAGCPEGGCADLSWDPSPTPGVTYRVHWGFSRGVLPYSTDVSGLRVRIPELPERTSCYFQITAVKDGLESRPEHGEWATPYSPPLVVLDAQRIDAHRVQLSWTPCSSPDLLGYVVYRRTEEGRFTRDDLISPGILTATSYVDSAAVPYVENTYAVSPVLQNLFEGDPSAPRTVFPREDRTGRGILLVNDYMWYCTSDGPYPSVQGDPYEMYDARVLTGNYSFTFWDARPDLGWWAYPPGHTPVGYGPLDGETLFDHGVLLWSAWGPDGPYDERLDAQARLLREFHDAGGVIILASWQMGSYLPYDLYDIFAVKDFGRPNAVLANRRLLPQSAELSVIGPAPGVFSAPICDVLEPDPAVRHRLLYRLDFTGSPVLGLVAVDADGVDRAFLISVSPGYLDPVAFGHDMSVMLSHLPGAHEDPGGVPDDTLPGLRAGLAFPNPSRGSVRLDFELDRPEPVQSAVYDLQGRRVREILAGPLPAGHQSLFWDARDDAGRPVTAGVYFLCICTPSAQIARRVVLLD